MVSVSRIKWMPVLLSVSCLLTLGDAYSYMSCSIVSPTSLTATTSAKTFSYPGGLRGRYGRNQRCKWMITSSNPRHVVKLTVLDSQIEGPDFADECNKDYINVYDVQLGNFIFMDRFCGTKDNERSFRSSTPEMMVEFISNENFEFDGFRLSYKSVPNDSLSSSNASKKAMAISIPVGIITLCIVICLAVCFSRWWRSKRSAQRRNSQERNSSRLQPQSILSEPPYPVPLFDQPVPYTREDPHPSLHGWEPHPSLRGLEPHPSLRGLPLRVVLPEFSQERSSTPPPSYEYLVRHESLLGPQGEPLPECPPDYETVVKDDAMQGHESPV